MSERLTLYGIILVALYIGMYIWNQKEEVVFLNQQLIEQNSRLEKHRELIGVQIEYIELLEMQYYNPLHKPPLNLYRDPI